MYSVVPSPAGSALECVYKLMTFGITREAIPVSVEDETTEQANHHEMLKALKFREQHQKAETTESLSTKVERSTASSSDIILVPSPMDILMGRGRHPKCRPGGLRMHSMLLEHRAVYDMATKVEKTVIAETILKVMKKSGCRFLTSAEGGGFVECDDSTARKKISHGFRNLRLKGSDAYLRNNDRVRKRNLS
jgi:hypothetical protein